MARQLRLHFASRRSNTDPLSESLSSHGEDTEASVSAHSPAVSLAQTSVHLKVTPLSPENGILQQHSALFIPRINAGACNKKSVVRIALQTCGKPSGEVDGTLEDAEGGACTGSDKGSCSSMASDPGYCSSNSIFEAESPEKQRITQEHSILRCKSKVPLRRCSSLVIFPKSPCSTPPASPDSSVAVAPNETSQDVDISCEGFSGVGGHFAPKGGCSVCRAARNIVQFNKTEENNRITEQSCTLDRSNRHSRCVRLHFAHQKPVLPGKGATVHLGHLEAYHRLPHPPDKQEANKKTNQSTSAGLFSNRPPDKRKRASEKSQLHGHCAIQRSISLEVPYPNTGISCHVSNPQLSNSCSPHVHIHLSPFCPNKLPNDVHPSHFTASPNKKSEVSILHFKCMLFKIYIFFSCFGIYDGFVSSGFIKFTVTIKAKAGSNALPSVLLPFGH